MTAKIVSALAGAALALATGAPAAGAVELILNGGFDNPAGFVNGGGDTMNLVTGSTAMTGWTVFTDDLMWIGPANPYGFTGSNGGGYLLDLTGFGEGGPFGGVSQTVATTAGAQYRLTFDIGSYPGYGIPVYITATVGGAAQSFASSSIAPNAWDSRTFDFTASGASTLISFKGAVGMNYIGLDNVRLVRTSAEPELQVPTATGAPEPAAWGLLILGLGGVGVALRAGKRRPRTA